MYLNVSVISGDFMNLKMEVVRGLICKGWEWGQGALLACQGPGDQLGMLLLPRTGKEYFLINKNDRTSTVNERVQIFLYYLIPEYFFHFGGHVQVLGVWHSMGDDGRLESDDRIAVPNRLQDLGRDSHESARQHLKKSSRDQMNSGQNKFIT